MFFCIEGGRRNDSEDLLGRRDRPGSAAFGPTPTRLGVVPVSDDGVAITQADHNPTPPGDDPIPVDPEDNPFLPIGIDPIPVLDHPDMPDDPIALLRLPREASAFRLKDLEFLGEVPPEPTETIGEAIVLLEDYERLRDQAPLVRQIPPVGPGPETYEEANRVMYLWIDMAQRCRPLLDFDRLRVFCDANFGKYPCGGTLRQIAGLLAQSTGRSLGAAYDTGVVAALDVLERRSRHGAMGTESKSGRRGDESIVEDDRPADEADGDSTHPPSTEEGPANDSSKVQAAIMLMQDDIKHGFRPILNQIAEVIGCNRSALYKNKQIRELLKYCGEHTLRHRRRPPKVSVPKKRSRRDS